MQIVNQAGALAALRSMLYFRLIGEVKTDEDYDSLA
jgi:hypothetical protein